MSDTPAARLAAILTGMWGWLGTEAAHRIADAILRAGYRPPARTITTPGELAGLADGALIQDPRTGETGTVHTDEDLSPWRLVAWTIPDNGTQWEPLHRHPPARDRAVGTGRLKVSQQKETQMNETT